MRRRRNARARRLDAERTRKLSPEMKRRVRAQRAACGSRCKPAMWGYYPRADSGRAADPVLRFRAQVDHMMWSVMDAIVGGDFERAARGAHELAARIRTECSRLAARGSVVVDLGRYRRRLGLFPEWSDDLEGGA